MARASGRGTLVFASGAPPNETCESQGDLEMPRHLAEKIFPHDLEMAMSEDGAKTCPGVVGRDTERGKERARRGPLRLVEGQDESRRLADLFGLEGSILERKYRVDRVVGQGGFGVVYAGLHLVLERPIAIKVLRPMPRASSEQWADESASFLQEAKTIARLRHAAVVDVVDAGVTWVDAASRAVPWMVLEWLDGETLARHLEGRRGRGGRAPREALALMRPVIEAMIHAHDAGVIHGDLKPSNVMVLPSGDTPIKVIDFGAAEVRGDDPAAGTTATERWPRAFSAVCAAPEQLSGARTGPWTDVYALALMLTYVLTDRSPYPDDAIARSALAFDEARRPTASKAGVDAGAWEEVLARALSVYPARRPPDARALLEELERTLERAPRSRSAG